MGLIEEFKEFAMKGNVVDLAVGVIIGAAFGKIVSAFTDDVIMPVIGRVVGKLNFSDYFVNLTPDKLNKDGTPITSLAQAKQAGAAVFAYGDFVTQVINFAIIAFSLFLLVKAMNRFKRAAVVAPPATKSEELLTEIRDLMKAQQPAAAVATPAPNAT
jgi:large conductance mechanosensitive channel